MNYGLLNLMDHYYGEKQCMFFTMLWIIMDLLDLIMDLLDHSGLSYENTWSCFHLM